jgi:hypothetical protein
MEAWSDQPLSPFRIKFFLDTNILSDIVDGTYSGLNIAIEYLKNSLFTDLISSRYVVFEFIDVRKKLLYLDEVNKAKGITKRHDANSIIRYKEHFERAEVDFHAFKTGMQSQIENELATIVEDLGIIFDENLLHDNLLNPTKEINLFTKISREDGLILISSIWPEESQKESFVVLLTRDKPFVDSFNEINLQPIFDFHDLNSPIVEYIESMQLNGNYHLNLTEKINDPQIADYLLNKLKELLIIKNRQFFLGKTIHPGNGPEFPLNVVCFRLEPNIPLFSNIYLTMIGKDLDFVYTTRLSISSFWNQIPILNYPFQNDQPTNISFRPEEENNGVRNPLPQNICNKLRETGNLVFINQDGENI